MLIDAEIEHFSSGMVLQVGSEALIRLSFLCEPCAYLDKIQPGLAKRIKGKRGFLGIVVRDGEIGLEEHLMNNDSRFMKALGTIQAICRSILNLLSNHHHYHHLKHPCQLDRKVGRCHRPIVKLDL